MPLHSRGNPVYREMLTTVPAAANEIGPALPGEQVRYGLYRELLLTPGGPVLSYVRCGRTRILERDPTGKYVRVAMDFLAGEVFGWIEAPTSEEPDFGCGVLMTSGLEPPLVRPHGYSWFFYDNDRLRGLARARKTIYWGSGGDRRRCSAWRFQPKGKTEGLLVRDAADLPPSVRRETLQYALDAKQPFLSLSCPETYTHDGGPISNGCVWDIRGMHSVPL
jgi:hypothetical protein